MSPAPFRKFCLSATVGLALAAAGGCERAPRDASPAAPAPAQTATPTSAPPPAPRALLEPDASNATIERAAPPTLRAVATGVFEPGNPVAEAVTGRVTIEDTRIAGANGALFVTERVAIVRGGDEFTAGQRYADVMMMDADQPVELRRVIDETPPTKAPGNAFCARLKTGYLALASYTEGDNVLVKVIGLQGDGIPAATARDTTLCASTFYLAPR
ncbi:MAG TPA: hypothetical protein VLK29_07155 [Luteimonas sp.]|nr:hypothetical protein [Luteimonas sp.]